MHDLNKHENNWLESFKLFRSPKVATMLFLGFSAGLPLALYFSSLSLWLREAGFERSTVTYFSWAGLALSFKFIWSPLVDRLPIPFLTRKLGRRRAWLIIAQLMVMASIASIAITNPQASSNSLNMMALFAICLGFSSATQDIVIDAYRIESADLELQSLLASSYIAGYRGGMIISGAGALFLADYFGTSVESYNYNAWRNTYLIMSSLMLIGMITTFLISEPTIKNRIQSNYTKKQYMKLFLLFLFSIALFIAAYNGASTFIWNESEIEGFWSVVIKAIREFSLLILGLLAVLISLFIMDRLGLVERKLVEENYIAPVKDFFVRYGLKLAIIFLLFIGFYRVSDIVLGIIANVFYQDLGFSNTEIASVSKTYGLIMMIIGGFLGGVLALRFGVMRTLFIGGYLTVLTNLSFMVLAWKGENLTFLYFVISADNLAGGLASAAFIAFLSSLTNVSFTAVQYSIFSSLMTLFPKIIGGYSGSMVDNLDYPYFFLLASLMGVPVLFLIVYLNKLLELKDKNEN